MQFIPRKLLFKAWNQETKLMMRLNSIDCIKGELFRKDHILLQFTGLYDMQKEEIYEMDMILVGREKFVVVWDNVQNGWILSALPDRGVSRQLLKKTSEGAIRICSYFESEEFGRPI